MTIIENKVMNIICYSLPKIANSLERIADRLGNKTCCICGKEFNGYGHNPSPIKNSGVCCDECAYLVIKERIEKSGLMFEK